MTKIPDPYLKNVYKPISRSDVAIYATINSPRNYSKSNQDKIIKNDPFAFEGERKFELHKSIERDRKFRNKKIKSFLEEHNKLFCELCGFNFLEKYPFLKTDIIEVHHIIPLSSLSKSTVINLSDLMLLCSNCHFAIHQGDVEENLLIAMEYFESK